jgi:hypothetical protein
MKKLLYIAISGILIFFGAFLIGNFADNSWLDNIPDSVKHGNFSDEFTIKKPEQEEFAPPIPEFYPEWIGNGPIGDYDGDGTIDSLWVIGPGTVRTDIFGEGCYRELDRTIVPCTTKVKFSLSKILNITGAIGLMFILNEGDLNGDGSDELSVVDSWFRSLWRDAMLFTYRNGEWETLASWTVWTNYFEYGAPELEHMVESLDVNEGLIEIVYYRNGYKSWFAHYNGQSDNLSISGEPLSQPEVQSILDVVPDFNAYRDTVKIE